MCLCPKIRSRVLHTISRKAGIELNGVIYMAEVKFGKPQGNYYIPFFWELKIQADR